MKIYAVHQYYYDNGRTSANYTVHEMDEKPESIEKSTPKYDYYCDYVTSKREAEKLVTQCRNA